MWTKKLSPSSADYFSHVFEQLFSQYQRAFASPAPRPWPFRPSGARPPQPDSYPLIRVPTRPPPEQGSVGRIFHHLCFAGFRRVRADALSIDVDYESVEAELAEHLGALVGVFADAAPFWEHQT